jgi:predicted nucleic acid-binding protein
MSSVPRDSLFVSVLVIGELRRGVDLLYRRDNQQGRALERWYQGILTAYADRILPVTYDIADEWGRMNVPDRLPAVDGLMAATARIHRLTFVTRDVGRLAQYGVDVLNPFEPFH